MRHEATGLRKIKASLARLCADRSPCGGLLERHKPILDSILKHTTVAAIIILRMIVALGKHLSRGLAQHANFHLKCANREAATTGLRIF